MAFQLLFPTPFLHEKAEGEIFDAIQKEILDCVNKIKEDDDYESLSDVSDVLFANSANHKYVLRYIYT